MSTIDNLNALLQSIGRSFRAMLPSPSSNEQPRHAQKTRDASAPARINCRGKEPETTWTDWFDNPFDAAKAAAIQNGTPVDFDKVKVTLMESISWEQFDYRNYLDDVFQEIAGATNIVIQYSDDNRRFRAAYD